MTNRAVDSPSQTRAEGATTVTEATDRFFLAEGYEDREVTVLE